MWNWGLLLRFFHIKNLHHYLKENPTIIKIITELLNFFSFDTVHFKNIVIIQPNIKLISMVGMTLFTFLSKTSNVYIKKNKLKIESIY